MDAREIILTPEAKNFLIELHEEFSYQLEVLLEARENKKILDFLPETSWMRNSEWRVADTPSCLLDRRVEITGPPERKMVINALNSGARVFMADFEDSLSPTWENVLNGQLNLVDAVRKNITYEHPTKGTYKLGEDTSVLFVRPRGLHLKEENFKPKGMPIPAALFDFGLFFFHNAQELIDRGHGPYFYIPKLEHHLEARWWNQVFNWAQDKLSIPRGTIRATVLLETIPAAFQMEEILYELRSHSAGLNCGRWDYIFSYIKNMKESIGPLPDRDQIHMQTKLMESYSKEVIRSCHTRGAHAMGGMAAQVPIRGDSKANEVAMKRVRQGKIKEVNLGHDGTWVAHPGLVGLAMEVFDQRMPEKNQIDSPCSFLRPDREDLLTPPVGEITGPGVLKNIEVSILYIESWINGNGCVQINSLMEDAATAEISRSQIWQWLKLKAKTSRGAIIDKNYVTSKVDSIVEKYRDSLGEDFKNRKFDRARDIFLDLIMSDDFCEFLTLPAYREILID